MKDKIQDYKFPTVLELSGLPAAIIISEKGLESDEWIDLTMDVYWGRLQDQTRLGTPEVLWWNYLKNLIETNIKNKKLERKSNGHNDVMPVGDDFEKFIFELAKEFWQFYWRELASDKVDEAFQVIKQFGANCLSKSDHERLRGIRSKIRKKLGVKSKPSKLYSPTLPQKQSLNLKTLSQGVDFIFRKYRIKLSEVQISEYIAYLFREMNIKSGDESTIAETVRSNYLARRNNPLKNFQAS